MWMFPVYYFLSIKNIGFFFFMLFWLVWVLLLLFACSFFVLWGRVSHCNPDWPWTGSDPPVSASRDLGLVEATTRSLTTQVWKLTVVCLQEGSVGNEAAGRPGDLTVSPETHMVEGENWQTVISVAALSLSLSHTHTHTHIRSHTYQMYIKKTQTLR
jgi:hypothetical protein